jgi:nicotinate-nucleotide--dimethylbenzimidazole phosphoribosyltransferase
MVHIADYIGEIKEPDQEIREAARRRQDSLTKPRGSLGRLEELSVRMAGVLRSEEPRLDRRVIFTMAADHGVTEEGVSAYPSEVTTQMVLNFAAGGAAINVLAAAVGAEVRIVDMGVASDIVWPDCVIDRRIAKGTRNMAKGPAMSSEEAMKALVTGAELAAEAVADGAKAIAVGDMGIGNTTSASAITAAITGTDIGTVTGRGTGIADAALDLKVATIGRALKVNSPVRSDGVDVLSKVGGLEIGGMAGAILGAASCGVPAFLDGFVSGSAALIAHALAPVASEYMVASHLSVEPGHRIVLAHLGLEPLLDLDMRLGEGTGAALAFPIADAACKILNEMATFEGAGVSRSTDEQERKE